MSMINCSAVEKVADRKDEKKPPHILVDCKAVELTNVGAPDKRMREYIGALAHNSFINFWTCGRYALQDVLEYVLTQTGPAHVTACTWAVATSAAEKLVNMQETGKMLSMRIWIDPRIKVRTSDALTILRNRFSVAVAPVHAKVTCISNESWKVVIFGPQNFTTNPQPEQGAICAIDSVYQMNYDILDAMNYEGPLIAEKK